MNNKGKNMLSFHIYIKYKPDAELNWEKYGYDLIRFKGNKHNCEMTRQKSFKLLFFNFVKLADCGNMYNDKFLI